MLPKLLPPSPAPAQGADEYALVLVLKRAGTPQLGALSCEDEKSGFAQQQSSGFLRTWVSLRFCCRAVWEVLTSAWRCAPEDRECSCSVSRLTLGSQEGLCDPNFMACFPPKAPRFSCSDFEICFRQNNVWVCCFFFLNKLHHAVRVENSVGNKRHNWF